jgi:hypothetical protein
MAAIKLSGEHGSHQVSANMLSGHHAHLIFGVGLGELCVVVIHVHRLMPVLAITEAEPIALADNLRVLRIRIHL